MYIYQSVLIIKENIQNRLSNSFITLKQKYKSIKITFTISAVTEAQFIAHSRILEGSLLQ